MRYLAVIPAVLLSACSIYPVAPEKSQAELIARGRAETLLDIDLADARDLVVGLRSLLAEGAKSRQKTTLIVSELVYYGTLLAVGGSMADSIAARNVGGGVAALATMFGSHYQVANQQAAMQAAVDKLDCVRDAIAPISPAVRLLFDTDFSDTAQPHANPEIPGIGPKFDLIPRQTISAVRTIQDSLRVSLAGIQLSSPSKEDLAAVFGKFLDAKKTAQDSTKPVPPAAAKNALASVSANTEDGIDCSTPSTFDKAQQLACDIADLQGMHPEELSDAKRRFELSVRAYKETLDACIAVP